MIDVVRRRRPASHIHVLLVSLLVLFPLPYIVDVNFLGGRSAQGLENPLARVYSLFVLAVAVSANVKRPRFLGLCFFCFIVVFEAVFAFALGVYSVLNYRSLVSLILIFFLGLGHPLDYRAALEDKRVAFAALAAILICTAQAIRETISPVFVAENIDFNRVSAGFSHPNAFGLFLVAMFALVLFYIPKGLNRVLCFVGLSVAAVATKSLSVLALLGILFVASAGLRSWRFPATIALIVAVLTALMLDIVPFSRAQEVRSAVIGALTLDVTAIDYGSLQWRLAVWQENLTLMRSAGAFGYGFGTFSEVSGVGNLAHNVYVQLTVECGYIGITAYIVAIAFMAVQLMRGHNASRGLALWSILVVSGLSLNVLNYSAAICLVVYLCVALTARDRNRHSALRSIAPSSQRAFNHDSPQAVI